MYITSIIGHYNPSVRTIDLVSRTTYVVCVNFIHKWRDLHLKSIPNEGFLEKLFMAILFILRVFARSLLRRNRRRNTFHILFSCLAWGSNPGFSSNKPAHYLLVNGDFICTCMKSCRRNCSTSFCIVLSAKARSLCGYRRLPYSRQKDDLCRFVFSGSFPGFHVV